MRRHLLALALLLIGRMAVAEGCILVLPMNLEEMVGRADRIVVGTCVSVEAMQLPVAGANLPVTQVTFEVDDAIRGASPGPLVFRQFTPPGIEGLPQFAPGEQHLLLLARPATPQGPTTTVGLDQGAFLIETDFTRGQRVAVNGRGNEGLFTGLSPAAQADLTRLSRGAADPAAALIELVRELAGEAAR